MECSVKLRIDMQKFIKGSPCCVAVGCNMRAGTNLMSEIKMFRFPSDPVRKAMWQLAVRRGNWHPSKHSCLCSKHFITGRPSKDTNHPDYVPSIFSYVANSDGKTKIDRFERHINRNKESLIEASSSSTRSEFKKLPFKMPSFCAAYGCHNNSNKEECKEKHISFHKFPLNNKDLLKIWLVKICRKNFVPNKYSKLCSAHFEDDCFKRRKYSGDRIIKPDSIPTKFWHMKQAPKKEHPSYQFQSEQESDDGSTVNKKLQMTRNVETETCDDVITTLLSSNSELENGIKGLRFPKDPELCKARINAIKRKDCEPTLSSQLSSEHFTEKQIIRNSPISVRFEKDSIPRVFNFPSYMQKILEEKKQIESTYDHENINSSQENDINENVQSAIEEINNFNENSKHEDNSNQMNEIKINKVFSIKNYYPPRVGILRPAIHKLCSSNSELGTSNPKAVLVSANGNTCSNSNFIKVQNISPIVHKLSSSLLVKQTINTCDASTSTEQNDSVEHELRQRLASSELLLNRYRKKIKILQQQNRKFKNRLRNVQHSIFNEFLKKRYLSSDYNFKTREQDNLLDRQSIRPCMSSESETSDQDE